MKKLYDSETGCCKRFEPKPWDNKTITWKNKLFTKDRVFCLFHMPIGVGGLMAKNMELIEKNKALVDVPMMLFEYTSMFSANVYITVSKKIPGKQNVKINGTFLSKVFEGPYSKTSEFVEKMMKYAASKKKKIKTLYYYYPTCPACAKAYGKNYQALLGKI